MSTRLSTEERYREMIDAGAKALGYRPPTDGLLGSGMEKMLAELNATDVLNAAGVPALLDAESTVRYLIVVNEREAARRALSDLTARMDFHGIHQEWNELAAARAVLSENRSSE